ncbi:SDR family NAD(P)-dependent oxidoreductase, partial [Paenibacillus sonchi]
IVGRSELDGTRKQRLQQLQALAGEAHYIQGDVASYREARSALQECRKRFGSIQGVVHCAGVISDALLFHKERHDFDAVLQSKVWGTLNLDELTASDDLDFFVLFSSISSVFGNAGQSDYAYANRFMDEFAVVRDQKHLNGLRSGKSLSVNWPLWADGGMQLSGEHKKKLQMEFGMTELGSREGIASFEKALLSPYLSLSVLAGDKELLLHRVVSRRSLQLGELETLMQPYVTASVKPQGRVSGILDRESPAKVLEDDDAKRKRVEELLAGLISAETRLPAGKVQSQRSLDEYGLNSLMIMNMTGELISQFGALPQTLFFEHRNLEELAAYIVKAYPDQVAKLFGGPADVTAMEPEQETGGRSLPEGEAAGEPPVKEPNDSSLPSARREEDGDKDERIAIIGISGRYPMARTLEDYWNNLKSGRDCIVEIPADRWDLLSFFDPNKEAKGKSYTKWGGFLDGIDEFDPLFFNISPKEAELMDPQERLFLECAWETLEDSGYTRKRLEKATVGVYVGAMWSQYQLYGAAGDEREKPTSSFSSIANRVSYVMNFTGPSMAIDTMCSSSLTAIKLACDSLIRGETDYALAGGVNVASHPNKYILVSQGKFGSTDGKCRSFGEGGDGYVPGEGVGAVLLKPLDKAVRDGDSIYGVIAGTSLNHGGKTNGYTVPSPVSQAKLLKQAFHESGIDPRTISYLEAHGTGTALGDPIEIEGINRAFESFTEDKEFCAIGSVKSNVGHLESAAGIAALTKVLLQMRERMLVPSLHSDQLNPRIDFPSSPVRVQRVLSEWSQPVRMMNGRQETYPRRAGISSFGAGGSNAFLVVEEYVERKSSPSKAANRNRQPASIAVLSARTRERLYVYAGQMKAFVNSRRLQEGAVAERKEAAPVESLLSYIEAVTGVGREQLDTGDQLGNLLGTAADIMHFVSGINQKFGVELNLHEIAGGLTIGGLDSLIAAARIMRGEAVEPAILQTLPIDTGAAGYSLQDLVYTLQTGREHFEERLAIVCEDYHELSYLLDVYLQDGKAPGLYSGCASDKTAHGQVPALDPDHDTVHLTDRSRLNEMARRWTEGSDIPWKTLYSDQKHRPVKLPTYPFSRERYWIETGCALPASPSAEAVGSLRPFIDANVSTFEGLSYTKLFSKESVLIKDHVVQGDVLVPGAAMIEMVRSAGSLANPGKSVTELKHAMWFSPLDVTAGSKQATIRLTPAGDQAEFAIVTDVQGEQTVHFKGVLAYGSVAALDSPLDLSMIRERCRSVISPDDLYSRFYERGFQYGPSYQVMAELYHNDVEALGLIRLPSRSLQNEGNGFHPAIWDGAMQSVAALAGEEPAEQAGLPFAIKEIEIYGDMPTACWVHTVEGNEGYAITICCMSGNRLARINGFRLTGTSGPKNGAEGKGLIYVQEQWKPVELAIHMRTMEQSLLVFDDDNARFEHIRDELAQAYPTILRVRTGAEFRRTEFGFELNPDEPGGYHGLFESLREFSPHDFHIIWLWTWTNTDEDSASYEVDNVHSSALRLLYFTRAIAGVDRHGQTKILFVYAGHRPEWESSCAAAFAKSVCLESKQEVYRTVRVDDKLQAAELAQLLYREVNAIQQSFAEIAYTGGKRMMRVLEEADAGLQLNSGSSNCSLVQKRPVYVITGGAGGLGLVFARYLAAARPCILVLAGRSELNADRLAVLGQLGGTVEISYMRCDLSDSADTHRLFQNIRQRHGAIHGVIHAAGVARDSLVKRKSGEELQSVLAAKVNGIFHVDEATKDEPLEFFVAFSSIAAVAGSRGQADYAFANRYMDEYMERRHQLTGMGRRSGVSLSVNWPLWLEGGMMMPAAISSKMEEETGLTALQTDQGVMAFEAMLGFGYPRLTVAAGRLDKMREWLFRPLDISEAAASGSDMVAPSDQPCAEGDPTPEQASAFVKQMISRTTKVAVERIRDTDTFDRYGMDSVMLMSMGRDLEAVIGADGQTVFVEYNTVREVSGYLLHRHRDRLAVYFQKDSADAAVPAPSVQP